MNWDSKTATETVNEAEIMKLAEMTIRGSGPRTDDQIEEIVKWAHQVRIASTMLDGVLDGRFTITQVDGQALVFGVAV